MAHAVRRVLPVFLAATIVAAQGPDDKAGKLMPADVAAMERDLERNAEDLQIRAILTTYYTLKIDKQNRLRHALWFAENHPESVGDCHHCKIAAADSPLDSMESFERARSIWLRHAESRTTDPRVLMNAASFATQFDPNLSERLLLQGRELEPRNRRWDEDLADLYGKGIFTDGRFRPQTPPSAERQAFARRARLVLEQSSNPLVVGYAGLRLAPQDVAILRTRSAEEISLGEKLLHKARDLAPQDPQWDIYIRDFESARRDLERPDSDAPVASDAPPGTLVRRLAPEYPEPAGAAGIQRTVHLRILIGRNGRVIVVRVVDGPPELQAAAAAAVKQWLFQPFLLNGIPAERWENVALPFP